MSVSLDLIYILEPLTISFRTSISPSCSRMRDSKVPSLFSISLACCFFMVASYSLSFVISVWSVSFYYLTSFISAPHEALCYSYFFKDASSFWIYSLSSEIFLSLISHSNLRAALALSNLSLSSRVCLCNLSLREDVALSSSALAFSF